MEKIIEKVEIKEPPIQELSKKKSCFWRSCTTGCAFIFIFLIISLFLIRFATTPKVKVAKELPRSVELSVPLYDTENIEKIAITAGKDRSKAVERAVVIPKIILSPILVTLEKHLGDEDTTSTKKSYIDIDAFRKIIEEPIADHRDIVQIEWRDLPATPWFVASYYKTELRKKGFDVIVTSDKGITRQFSFHKNNIDGAVYIKGFEKSEGTEFVIVTINLEKEK